MRKSTSIISKCFQDSNLQNQSNLLFILVIIIFSIGELIAQPRVFTKSSLTKLADRSATELWGNVYPDDPIPYYGPNNEIIAYHFTWSIDKEFPDKQSLIEQCNNAFESGSRKSGWGDDEFGNIVIGANDEMPVFIEYSKCLPKQYAMGKKLEKAAEKEFGSGYSLDKTYYLGLVEVWFGFTNGSDKKYLNLEPFAKVMEEVDFRKYMDDKNYFWNRDEFTEDWVKFLDNKDPIDGGTVYIPGEEFMPYLEWSYGCSPTAAAMLLAWWDNYHNFGNLIDYHVERWDNIQENYDYHVPITQNELRQAMGTNSSGGTYRGDMSDGYIEVVENRGYNCSSDGHWAFWWTVGELFDDVKTQINNNRPLQVGIDNHSLTGVGYNNACKTVKTHDSNQSSERSINRSMLEATFWVFISDNYGTSVDLEAPNGGSEWGGNGGDDKETLASNDFFEITWSCPAPTNTYVKLYYHDEGGWDLDRWFLIDDNTENDGSYIWHVPTINSYYGTSTEHARIKIEVYDLANNLIAADGSFGNFNIDAGGGLTQLTTTALQLTETNPDFYSIHLNSQTWSVVGVRDKYGYSDWWYLDMYDNVGFSNFVDQSHNWEYVNYIVLNGHSYPTGWYGIKPWNSNNKVEGRVQFDNDASPLGANATHNLQWTNNDVVKIWDTYLTSGTYYFVLDVDTLSPLDLNMALYKWGGDNLFPMEDNVGSSSNFGFGVDESFHYTVWEEGSYGLCISSSNGTGGDFDVSIHGAGKWTGALNEHWNFPQNWANNTIPSHIDDVIIPANCVNMPLVYSGAAFCRNLTIEDGAHITINDHDLVVYGDLKVFGYITMLGPNSELTVENSIQFEEGSWIDIQDDDPVITCYRSMYVREGSWMQLQHGTVRFVTGHPSYIINNSVNAHFNDVIIDKTAGNFEFHPLSTEMLEIKGDLQIYSGSTFLSNSEQPIWLYEGLSGLGDIKLNEGTCVFIGDGKSLDLSSESYFNNIRIYTSNPSLMFDDLTINGNLVIDAGGLMTVGNDIYIGGDWENNAGPEYFWEGSSKVVFIGNTEQSCYGEEFSTLEMDGSELYFPSGITTCEQYDFTYGSIVINGGTFTANDLVDNGIWGTIYVEDGELNFHQDNGQYVDLNCEIYMDGGVFNIYGGSDDSYWSYANNVELHMQGGVLDFKDVGIRIHDGSYNFYSEFLEGVVRTAGNLFNDRYDFNPTHGTFELYGFNQAQINCVTNGSFFNIDINKNATKGVGKSYYLSNPRIPIDPILNPKANDVALTHDLTISGDLNIISGSFDVNGYNLDIGNDLVVDDEFIMTHPTGITYVHGNILWNANSLATVTEGDILVDLGFYVFNGANVQFGINHTLSFSGEEISGFYNHVTGTSLGELKFNKTDGYTIFNSTLHSTTVNGDVLVYPNNEVRFSGTSIECNAIFYGDDDCVLVVSDDAFLEMNSTFILDGHTEINSGTLLCHDQVQINTPATIDVNGGYCTWDRPYSASYFNIFGGMVINEGVFEVTNDGINMGPSGSIAQDGGTVNIGWGIYAVYPGNYLALAGTLEFIGPQTGIISFEASNNLHNLTINRTSTGSVNNVDVLTINNDLRVINDQFSIGANNVLIGGDVIIESTGSLKADLGDLFVGGDWINYAGDAGFLEGSRKVTFNGNGDSHVLYDETFYDLDVNISGAQYDYLYADPNTTINILGDLNIISCSFRLDANATVNIEGDLTIGENTNLFASTYTDSYINLKGAWNNYNTTGYPWVNGFVYGMSTVKFTGDDDAWLTADCGLQEFYNLQISVGTHDFYPYSDVTVQNDVTIIAGNWVADESGLTFTFKGDIDIMEQGEYNDNSNNVVIAGENEQQFNNGSGLMTNIRNLNINMTSTGSESLPLFWLIGNLHVNEDIVVDTGEFFINSNTVECEGNFIVNENGKISAPQNSTIAMGNESAFKIDGGQLQMMGNGTYNPKVTSINGYYEFSILNQGTIEAANATFENMDDSGVNIYSTGLAYGTNTFSNCTFRNGIAGGWLLQINNDQDLIINEADFPDNTWGGLYNVRKSVDQGSVTFTNVTGDFSGSVYENDPYNRIGWDDQIPGIWTGAVNYQWNESGNWQHNLKPTATDDVLIQAGLPEYPVVYIADQECNNITIEPGASLRVYDETLTVYGSMIIYGDIIMDNAAGVLNVGDHYGEMISWEAGSNEIVNAGTINVYGNWYFKNGTTAQFGDGNTVNFYGDNRSYIYCDSPTASFGNIEINKTTPPKDFVYIPDNNYFNVTQDLYVYDGELNISDGAQVNVGNEFYIDNGGRLSAVGMAGNEVVVSGAPNYCLLEIANGGTISAEYAIFEYIEAGGVTVNPGATIDPAHPFNYCTFRESPVGGILLNIANSQVLTIDGANFPPNYWSGAYNVSKPFNSGYLTFTNVEGGFVGESNEDDPYGLIDWPGVVAGIWSGMNNSIWHVTSNWKYFLKPTIAGDVIIPAGTPNDPRVVLADQECGSITIEAGAKLEIEDKILTVNDNLIIHGELIMNQTTSVLNVGDSFGDYVSWEAGSTDDVTKGTINVYGDWYFKNGTNAQLHTGNTVNFYGDNNSTINCDDSNAEFGSIKINKTNSSHNVVFIPANTTIRILEDLAVMEGEFRLDEGTILTAQNELYVSNGGILKLKGTPANPVLVSGYPSYPLFEIASGGTISASYANFEFFNSNGVVVENGALIDPTYPFNNCTFRESPAGGTLLSINNDQVVTIEGATFPTNIWSGGYNVRKTLGQGEVTFIDFSGSFSGEVYEDDPNNRITWFHDWYNMNLKVYLEGPFTGSMMTTDLTADIPLAQPFNTAPWYYEGLEVMGEVPIKMVDWVLVELRDASNASSASSSKTVARKAAVLSNNGRIRDLGGLIDIQFNEPINDYMFVVIWHRNHLGVMTAYPVFESDGTYSYDFSILEDQVYGDVDAHKEIAPGIWGMISGDANSDGEIGPADKGEWSTNAGKHGYLGSDFNLDTQINNKDKNDIWYFNLGKESQIPD